MKNGRQVAPRRADKAVIVLRGSHLERFSLHPQRLVERAPPGQHEPQVLFCIRGEVGEAKALCSGEGLAKRTLREIVGADLHLGVAKIPLNSAHSAEVPHLLTATSRDDRVVDIHAEIAVDERAPRQRVVDVRLGPWLLLPDLDPRHLVQEGLGKRVTAPQQEHVGGARRSNDLSALGPVGPEVKEFLSDGMELVIVAKAPAQHGNLAGRNIPVSAPPR